MGCDNSANVKGKGESTREPWVQISSVNTI